MSDSRTTGVEREVRVLDRYGREVNVSYLDLSESSKTRSGGGMQIPDHPDVLMPVPERTASLVEFTTRPLPVQRMADVFSEVRNGIQWWTNKHGYLPLLHSAGLTRPVEGFKVADASRFRLNERKIREPGRPLHTSADQPHYGTISDPDECVRVAGGYASVEHIVLALSGCSPFFEGTDTGYSSYRYHTFGRMPTVEHLPQMHSFAQYRQWAARLVSAVLSRPMQSDADLSHVHAWTRPTLHGSVETRIADIAITRRETLLIAKLTWGWGELARRTDVSADWTDVSSRRLASWEAARWGLSRSLAHPVTGAAVPAAVAVRNVVDSVEPILAEFGLADDFRDGVEAMLAKGNGARRLRRAHAYIHHRLVDEKVPASLYPWRLVVRGEKVIPGIERRALVAYLIAAEELDDLSAEAAPLVMQRATALFEQFREDPRGLEDGIGPAPVTNSFYRVTSDPASSTHK